ncbi:hypothetical protein BDC45DRAFT_538312 [Circinella umbellata]|nr:hypothetical protein BDC45DRAFT_538312 [Circinella umbellata]
MRIVHLINTVRFLVLTVSLIAFICHIIQCILLSEYQSKTKIPTWTSAGHWQYFLWYIGLSISTISGVFVCTNAGCCKRGYRQQSDRYLGILNALPLLISLLTDIFVGGPEPWTAGTVSFDRPHTKLFQSCVVLDSQSVDQQYPLLYQRCLLSDGTWLGAAVACVLWIMLACLVIWAKNPTIKSNSVSVAPAKEPKWGRYIPEPPPSLRSCTLPIVPPPPRNGSIGSQQNSYYQPRSDVSFDSQPSSSDYYYSAGNRNQFSSNYNESPYSPTTTTDYSSPYNNYTNSYSTPTSPYYNSSSSNHSQLTPMLPMVPQMDIIDLFDNTAGPPNSKTDRTDSNNKTSSGRFSGLFSSPASPTTQQLPLAQSMSPSPHFPPTALYQQQQEKRISWGFSNYQYNPTNASSGALPPPYLNNSALPTSPTSPTTSLPSNYIKRPLSGQHSYNYRHSVASASSFGYFSSPSNNSPSRAIASNKDYHSIGSKHNNRYSSPPSSTPGADNKSYIEARRPSIVTEDPLPSSQKHQQYNMHRSSF